MIRSRYEKKYWPSKTQKMLLQASLLGRDEALAAWEEWRSRVDIERLDHGSSRLLPLLYCHLRKLGVEESPLTAKLKGAYRYTWARNQRLLHDALPGLQSLPQAGIDTKLIKGMALALFYYRDRGARRMNSIDVLVPALQVGPAMEILKLQGWSARSPAPERLIPIRHAAQFVNRAGHRLDLHWHLLLECVGEHASAGSRNGTVTGEVDNHALRALNATDQLFQTCVYGLSGSPGPPLQWAADAWTILRAPGPGISWEQLLTLAERCRLTVPVRETLLFLSEELGAEIPTGALEGLRKLPSPGGERIEHALKLRCQRHLGVLPLLWFSFRRQRSRRDPRGAGIGFLRYLQYTFGLPHLWHLPQFFLSAGLRRFRAALSTRPR